MSCLSADKGVWIGIFAVGNDNTIITESSIVISKTLENSIYIDTPEANTTVKNSDVIVSGWALNSAGTKQVNIYLNNKHLGTAQYGSERNDVNRAYPGYPSAMMEVKLEAVNLLFLKLYLIECISMDLL